MLKVLKVTGLCFLLSACTGTPSAPALKPTTIVRGVDSGKRQIVDDYYSVQPNCGNSGYPEIKILKMPSHGTVATEKGEVYPNFPKDNVRYECNRNKVASSRLFYESTSGFQGTDFFTIEVRFENSNLRLLAYSVDVR